MLDVFTTSTYEEIRRATVDGYVDFDVFDRQLFEDIRDQLTHPDNSDAAHNVMYEAFDLCADAGEITNALMSFMNSGSLDSAQFARKIMQEAVDKMTRDEIQKIAEAQ
ncbi:MAG: hypothetical protein CMP84_15970 [Gammaproteobacteria bacterium]|nr:hypothetical protein [Gammaproteobacteria bacterium]MAC71684.1 hypothetical protein [Gammaproteobacteria bacterium]|tara:strand:- start:5507 stop:5830 length:324 start_codon:yes stop_codon:yes gene_type:complete